MATTTAATLVVMLVIFMILPHSAQDTSTSDPMDDEVVCGNMDIRNKVSQLEKLENCTVIEGFLQILLIDKGQPKDYENMSFPKLREISSYLLLYRTSGLQSLGKLFPNLAVIRGTNLFYNYAFVVYEMFQLHEIGLGSLTDILRGSVRIEKNPNLCYVDTIDWDLITKSGKEGHFIKDNKQPEQCPNACPSNETCPSDKFGSRPTSPLCWNSHFCQKVCPTKCEKRNATCFENNQCCHHECLGGCTGLSTRDCYACRHVRYQGRCVKSCPHNTFEYINRRCIQEDECLQIKHSFSTTEVDRPVFWKPFQKKCLIHCPPGYVENDTDRHKCEPCKDKCPKVCSGLVVDSVAAAQKLRGCTYINGSLEIQIQGGSNIIKELELNLNAIQEIKGYLKVARSFPLISLNFLSDLHSINGEELDKKEYSLLVLDNQNLQELWDWDNRKQKLRIHRGKIFFHFNSKLCPSKIKELKNQTNVMDWDDRDVSPSSNGDRVACDVSTLNVTVWEVKSTLAVLKWESFRKYLPDSRSLLGYVIYYREAPYHNITIFDGRDACGADVWKVDDVEASDDDNDVYHLMTHLKPFTNYAFYIRTYTIASSKQGAQSNITYFETKPDTPTPPSDVRVRAVTNSDIAIVWNPPKKPNGNVTHYIIEGIREVDSSEFINQRNYCIEPLALPDLKKPLEEKDHTNSIQTWFTNATSVSGWDRKEPCCPCLKKDRPPLEEEEEDAESQIQFEDFLHNNVYVKNPANKTNSSRQTRDTKNFSIPTMMNSKKGSTYNTPLHLHKRSNDASTSQNVSENNDNTSSKFEKIVYHQTHLEVFNLHHFTEYTIEIRACQNVTDDSKSEVCSRKAIKTVRTLPLGSADDIDYKTIIARPENLTAGCLFLKWDEPPDPNGLIVSYHIEYKKMNVENYKPTPVCITRMEYQRQMGFTLTNLAPGNYSLRLRATSLAGNGNWTQPVYYYNAETKDGLTPEVLAAVIVAVTLAIIMLISLSTWVFVKRKFGPGVPDGILYASVNPEYISAGLVYEPDEWEVPREKITLLRELGQGSFGMVYEGEAMDIDNKSIVKCAVKTVNESASTRERIEFLQEASVMKAFNCHHVVKLLGVVSKGHPTLVIMELMANGDLKSYLRSLRPEAEDNPGQHPPTLKQIFQMAVEIADGMAYLAAKKFVHRDLAARNCMVAEDLTVKIGDFGMTRDIYETDYYRKGGKGLLPVRWMAPESLKDGVFTSQSDVWSYGVVLWEMATLASQPYQGLSNEQVLNYVISGRVMEKPENCPERLYALMKLCWEHKPKARPTFTELIETLLPEINHRKFQEISFYFTQRLQTCNKENEDLNDNPGPETPLKSKNTLGETLLASYENSDDEVEMHYFPSVTEMPRDMHPSSDQQNSYSCQDCGEGHQCKGVHGGEEGSKGLSIHSNEDSHGMSVTSSDGSKGSKVSNVSNGSVVNGHISFPAGRTTTC